MRFLVMMPTFNEIEILKHSVENLLSELPEANLLIVDDNSPDGTGALADKLASKDDRVSVLHRAEKGGLGAAYGAAVQWGLERKFDYLIQMDADGSHRPVDLRKMLEYAQESDLVIGSRWCDGGEVSNWSPARELISKLGNAYTRLWLGGAVRDMTAGFRIYSNSLAQNLPFGQSTARGYGFQVEMTIAAAGQNARIREVPIKFVEREGGRSKMTAGIIVEAFLLTTKWGVQKLLKR